MSEAIDQLSDDRREVVSLLHDVEVTDIKVTGDTATAIPTLDGERGEAVTVRRVGDDWKVDDFSVDGG